MFQGDSIASQEAPAAGQTVATGRGHQLTPREVLSWLPSGATPEQQDSMIQKYIKPAKIHWSNRPDTLHLPGHPVGKSYRDFSLPQYYRESFFSRDSLFHPELSGGRLGVAGDPVPYTIAGDNLITSLLLGCFFLGAIALAQSRRFIARQAKNFFFVQRSATTELTETSSELHFQLFLVFQTCLLFALGWFFYTQTYVASTFIIDHYKIIGIFTGIIATYFLVKLILYSFTGWVFFDKKKNVQWLKSILFLFSMEGLFLFPVIMLQAYINLPLRSVLIYGVFVVLIVKLLTLYKLYLIFFHRKGQILQIFLYFCALELMPLGVLVEALALVDNYLKINF